MSTLLNIINRLLLSNRLVILMYHIIVPVPFHFQDWCILDLTSFTHQMRYLKSNFDLLPLETAVENCRQGDIKRPTAAVTFDDGYQNNFSAAFPILSKLKVPATIFLTTGLIDTDDTLWFGRLNTAFAETAIEALCWKGRRFELKTKQDKTAASRYLQAFLKNLSHDEIQDEVRQISIALGCNPDQPISAASPFRMLDSASIQAMADSDLISFGAHTHTHPLLSRLSPTLQAKEIGQSLQKVEALTGKPCGAFAYPNGEKSDYTEDTVRLLQQFKVNVAVTTESGCFSMHDPPLEANRVGIGGAVKKRHSLWPFYRLPFLRR